MTILGALIGLILVVVLNALVIYIVGRMNRGLTVDSFGAAAIAAIVIGIARLGIPVAFWLHWLHFSQ